MDRQQHKIVSYTIAMLVIVALLTGFATFMMLYNAAMRVHSERLIATADTTARLVSLSLTIVDPAGEDALSTHALLLQQMLNSSDLREGLGRSGEIIIARQGNKGIHILASTRADSHSLPPVIEDSSKELAILHALHGESGTMSDIDYANRPVLAAYQPVADGRMALVTRVELAEIRKPFFSAALGAGSIIAVVLLIVPLLYTRLSAPMFRRLSDEQNRYRELVELSPYGVLVIDIESAKPLTCNKVAHEQLGYTADEFLNLRITDYEAIEDPEETRHHIEKILTEGYDEFDTLHRTKSGELRHVHVHARPFTFDGRLSFHTIFRDITDQVAVAEELKRHRNNLEELVKERNTELLATNSQLEQEIAERIAAESQLKLADIVYKNTVEGVFVTDAKGTILTVNPAFSTITGYALDEVIGKNPRILKSHHQPAEFYNEMWRTLTADGRWTGEIWNRRKSGEAYLQHLTITMNPAHDGKPLNYVAVFTDITELHEKEERIRHQAYHDALTGLPNRVLYQDRLQQSLLMARRTGHKLAVLFLDLDRFKVINDTFGHHMGDELLRTVATRLSGILRQSDTVSRFGGDEFVILLTDIEKESDAKTIARKIIEVFSEPVSIGKQDIFISTSIGISLYPENGEDTSTLLKNADAAMYSAKEAGSNSFRFYTSDMNAKAPYRLAIEARLRKALDSNALELHYQPRVNIETGAIVGAEALIRWHDTEHGSISPADFIPIAEESGLIVTVGEWVLENACRQALLWRNNGYDLRISINLSPRQFGQSKLVDKVAHLLEALSLPGHCIELELTESMLMQHADQTIETLKRFKALGIAIAIDDFGTGYSSLSYLKMFPIDTLKIDRSFVRDLASNSNDAAIIETIISLGRNLDIEVVAEGVETATQLAFLEERNCDAIQGYYFSKAVPASEMSRLLEHDTRLVRPVLES